ncbi:MAG TPA: penicillin-binding protein 2 [Chloroflexota bacterium]|nr:penicillin-binding protein 2 [Chloroflexota bacterium]
MAATMVRRPPARLYGIYAAVGVCFLALMGQLWYVQIANNTQFVQRAEVNRVRVVTEKPLRGVVYDRSGRQVTRNVPSWTLAVRPADLPRVGEQRDQVIQRVARVFEMDPSEIARVIEQAKDDPFTPARVKSPITRELALTVEEQQDLFPGVVIQYTPIRQYPEGATLGKILGYTGPIPASTLQARLDSGYQRDDTLGLSGIEVTFEDELRGAPGRKQVEVDALGRETSVIQVLEPVRTGGNIVLSIDAQLQRRAEELLAAGMAKAKSGQGAVVALDPRNGDVLALVSLPNYDNNLFASGISSAEYRRLSEDRWTPLVNHALGGLYPPGSTFKMVTAAAALQERVVTPQTRINCPGSVTVNGRVFRNWNPLGQGQLTVRQAIAQSCDIFFYESAGGNPYSGFKGLGIQKLAEYARAFGFGERSGVRLLGEERGLVPTEEWKRDVKKEPWFIGDNYNVGIGQGDLLVTPLQLANMTAAIANGGTLYKPRIATAVRDDAGNVLSTLAPEVMHKLPVAPEHLNVIRAGMRDVVASPEGTAYFALKQPALSLAGKTGTAEFYGPLDSKGNLPTHALFVGYAPAEDPRIAVAVIVYHGGEGSETAAPIAAEVLKAYFELGVR